MGVRGSDSGVGVEAGRKGAGCLTRPRASMTVAGWAMEGRPGQGTRACGQSSTRIQDAGGGV
jgi:hypothetical protein